MEILLLQCLMLQISVIFIGYRIKAIGNFFSLMFSRKNLKFKENLYKLSIFFR